MAASVLISESGSLVNFYLKMMSGSLLYSIRLLCCLHLLMVAFELGTVVLYTQIGRNNTKLSGTMTDNEEALRRCTTADHRAALDGYNDQVSGAPPSYSFPPPLIRK